MRATISIPLAVCVQRAIGVEKEDEFKMQYEALPFRSCKMAE